MIRSRLWAIRCKTYYIKAPDALGWPYLTFPTQKAAQEWIATHKIDGVAVRVAVVLKEVL
jgi:hypothetical protein